MSMLTSRRSKRPAADAAQQSAVAEAELQDVAAGSVVVTTLTDLSSPADFAAEAGRLRVGADAAEEAAAQAIAAADERVAEVTARAAQLVADARAQRAEVAAVASQGQRAAAQVAELASLVTGGGAEQEKVIDAAVRATGLAEEREQLTARADELGAELDRRRGERQEAEQKLAAARENGDAAVIGETLTLLTGMDDVAKRLTGQLAAARDRLAAIGDGSASFPGELSEALAEVDGRRRSVRQILNKIRPDRPEAQMDAAWGEVLGALEGNLERIREEQAASARPGAQTVLRGPGGQVVVRRG